MICFAVVELHIKYNLKNFMRVHVSYTRDVSGVTVVEIISIILKVFVRLYVLKGIKKYNRKILNPILKTGKRFHFVDFCSK